MGAVPGFELADRNNGLRAALQTAVVVRCARPKANGRAALRASSRAIGILT